MSHQDGSNEGSQQMFFKENKKKKKKKHMFLLKNKKKIFELSLIPPLIWSSDGRSFLRLFGREMPHIVAK